jgi:riboflavin biosynthesis pyrimidine reductase
MPRQLADRYAGSLLIPLREDRPTVVANFVSTLDGIVALGTGDLSGGGVISGFHEPDRFVMALLRALADVVVVGAGTLRGSKDHLWTPDHVHPDFADALAEWRAAMHLAPEPTTVIVTASGRVPLDHGGLDDPSVPVVLATTSAGAERLLRQPLGEHVSVVPLGDGPALRAADLIALSARRGSRLILTEGGPNLLGEFVRADRLDEIFLTVAPQLVGRGSGDRLGLVEGIALPPAAARWHELVSLRRSDDHLFLRYRQPTGGTSIVETQS